MLHDQVQSAGPISTQPIALLEIQNLITEFRTENETVNAINNISFSVFAGETVGIVGESGSGKSVTALSAMKLIPSPPGKITAGKILYNSLYKGVVDLTKISEKEMRELRGNEIAMIFQEPMTSLNPVFTCGEQVMEAILEHKAELLSTKKRNFIECSIRYFYKASLFLLVFASVIMPGKFVLLRAYLKNISPLIFILLVRKLREKWL